MKTRIKHLPLAILVVVACAASVAPAVRPIAPFEREQVKGHVRVVLLKIERSTFFTTEGMNSTQKDKVYPVPAFGITYLVEALGDEPITIWNDNQNDEVSSGGRSLAAKDLFPDNLIAGGYGYKRMPARLTDGPVQVPKLANEKRAVVFERFTRAAPLPAGSLRLKLHAGFNNQTEEFVFEGIPLD